MKLSWSVLLPEGLTVVCLGSEQEDVDDWKLCSVQAVLMLPPFIHEKTSALTSVFDLDFLNAKHISLVCASSTEDLTLE